MINIYSPSEIDLIRQSSRITAAALSEVLKQVAPGITTAKLDKLAEKLIREAGGQPSFMMEKGYHYTTCMNINDMVVHGIPRDYVLKDGDRLGVDLGTFYKGFHSDASWSVIVGNAPVAETEKIKNFLCTGEEALTNAIKAAVPGNHVGDISKAMQDTIEGAGYSCVRQLVGHGVGRHLHEDPEVPCYLRGKIANTPLLKPGMVLAIEAIYNQGDAAVVYENDDGWTIVSRDGSASGLFEHTVAITASGPEILTR